MPVYNNNFPRKARKTTKLVTRYSSWTSCSCVKSHENELMLCNVCPCRGGCACSTRAWKQTSRLPTQSLLVVAGTASFAHVPWTKAASKHVSSPRSLAPRLHTAAPAKHTVAKAKSHGRWWPWGKQLEGAAGPKTHQMSPAMAYKAAVQPTQQGCQPVESQQKKLSPMDFYYFGGRKKKKALHLLLLDCCLWAV